MRIAIHTLGCKVNQVETAALEAELCRRGHVLVPFEEAADAYIKRQAELRTREGQVLSLLGITGRPAVDGERKYIAAWTDMGFGDEVIRMAYERTVLKKQSMSWPYMNSILCSWHQKGLHTVEEIQAGDSGYPRRSPAPAPDRQAPPPSGEQEDIAWMKRFLAREREHDGKEGS